MVIIKKALSNNGLDLSSNKISDYIKEFNNFEMSITERMDLIINRDMMKFVYFIKNKE